jgi:hypothetical protein
MIMFLFDRSHVRYLIVGFWLAALVSFTEAPSSLAYYRDYVPAKLLAAEAIPQRLVALDFGHDWKCAVLPGITATNFEGQFSIVGCDSQGKDWQVSEDESRDFGGSCYTADVDGNGKQDILLHFPNASCGYPFSSLVIVFIDQEGRPHREEVVSRFSPGKNGIADIIRATSHKETYILQQDLAFGRFDNRDCGYWRWSALLAENCKLVEVKSAFETNFPCYVFFANRPNHLLSRHYEALERLFQKKL